MKKTIIATALLITGVFGVGLAVGQLGGITGTSAATAVDTPAATETTPDVGSPWCRSAGCSARPAR